MMGFGNGDETFKHEELPDWKSVQMSEQVDDGCMDFRRAQMQGVDFVMS